MENLTEINNALASNTPSRSVTIVCRKILKEKIDELKFMDKKLKVLAYDLINQLDVIVEVKKKGVETLGSDNRPLGSNVAYGLLGCLGLLSIVSGNYFIRFLGSAIAITSGFCIGRNLVSRTVPTKEERYVVTTTANEIMYRIEGVFRTLSPLAPYNQLDGVKKEVLRWLQVQYSSSDNREYKKDVRNLVEYLGYSFVEYEEGLEDFFKFSKANIPQEVTSVPAVKNNQTGVYIVDGIVVTPVK